MRSKAPKQAQKQKGTFTSKRDKIVQLHWPKHKPTPNDGQDNKVGMLHFFQADAQTRCLPLWEAVLSLVVSERC